MWIKQGRIYDKPSQLPTPVMHNGKMFIFFSFRIDGKSHIGFMEVNPANPHEKRVHSYHYAPSKRGHFDDSGIMPSCALSIDNQIWLYYTGWHLDKGQVPYGHGIGLLIGNDIFSLKKINDGPIMDRAIDEPFLCNSPCVVNNKMIYCSGTGWEDNFPTYKLRAAYSKDGINWTRDNYLPINHGSAISRPCCFNDEIWFSYKTKDKPYKISSNTIKPDLELGSGWESEMVCYPWIYEHAGVIHMLYNGNGYGQTGIGHAIWKP